jgi:hypothetical protein
VEIIIFFKKKGTNLLFFLVVMWRYGFKKKKKKRVKKEDVRIILDLSVGVVFDDLAASPVLFTSSICYPTS